ncbi:MAG: DUF4112 domain-containing protein [Verrucomicrobia bacterium]|nr:DUF4112 domain-containing protein [Verrucomicrobiota bacterium]
MAQSDRQVSYIETEVLPPSAKSGAAQTTDPFIAFISRLLDTFFAIPGTRIRFGFEPLINLFPFFGDQATSLISAALLYRSVQHRLPKIALVRMALNILINALIGMIPIIGDIFVFWFKPNVRNYRILERYSGLGRAASRGDWIFVSLLIGCTFFLIVSGTLLFVYALVTQFRWW